MPLSRSAKRRLRRVLIAAGVVLVLIQFAVLPRNVSAAGAPAPLPERYLALPEIGRLLAASCFDCHSDHTRYPWYSNVQPIGWVVNLHIREGRRHLDFTRFPDYSPRRGAEKLEQIAESIGTARMPHPSYLRHHEEARFSAEQKSLLVEWALSTAEKLREEDSLKP